MRLFPFSSLGGNKKEPGYKYRDQNLFALHQHPSTLTIQKKQQRINNIKKKTNNQPNKKKTPTSNATRPRERLARGIPNNHDRRGGAGRQVVPDVQSEFPPLHVPRRAFPSVPQLPTAGAAK